MGFVQKCGCGSTVSPLHSTTRVRISVIFTMVPLLVASRTETAETLTVRFQRQHPVSGSLLSVLVYERYATSKLQFFAMFLPDPLTETKCEKVPHENLWRIKFPKSGEKCQASLALEAAIRR
jgi:hypothetical protein